MKKLIQPSGQSFLLGKEIGANSDLTGMEQI